MKSAMALVSRATGPLAAHLGPWVSSLIDKQYVCAVVYVKARHAVAFDRWLPGHRIELEDLSEAHLTQYQLFDLCPAPRVPAYRRLAGPRDIVRRGR